MNDYQLAENFIQHFSATNDNHWCLTTAKPKKSLRRNVWDHCGDDYTRKSLAQLFTKYKLVLPKIHDGKSFNRSPLKSLSIDLPSDYPELKATIKERIIQALEYIKSKNMKLKIPTNPEKTTAPTNYFIILDNSGSMYGSIGEVKQAVHELKSLVREKDTVSLAYFSSYGDFSWIFKGANLSNADITKLIESKIFARGLTCFNQVLETVSETVKDVQLLTNNNNNVLYFASDGYPNDRSPENRLYEVCKDISGLFVASNVLGFSNYYNRQVLLNMAEKLKGTFTHVSNGKEMKKANTEIFKAGKKQKKVPIDQKYDVVWQILGNEIRILPQEPDNSVSILEESDSNNVLFGINYSELDTIELVEPSFVYSLAFVLSQKNKANLGVAVLKRAGDGKTATTLQKAFTVSGKGQAENVIKGMINNPEIPQSTRPNLITLSKFLEKIENGDYYFNVDESKFSKITRGGNYLNNVKFESAKELPKVTGIVRNADRPNISFQTLQRGQIVEILDADLKARVEAYNQTAEKPILLPIPSRTYKNYAFVANGDFNFQKLVMSPGIDIIPDQEIEIFESSDEPFTAVDFAKRARALIEAKAESSVITYLIKEQGGTTSAVDQRAELYGAAAVPLLKEIGLDSEMRYSAKEGSNVRAENADYIPFMEIETKIDKAANINAKEAYAKIQSGKLNKPAEICKPFFDKYAKLAENLEKPALIATLQDALKANKKLVTRLAEKLVEVKFRMVTTNSWFEDVPKEDKFMVGDVIIEVSEAKEYL